MFRTHFLITFDKECPQTLCLKRLLRKLKGKCSGQISLLFFIRNCKESSEASAGPYIQDSKSNKTLIKPNPGSKKQQNLHKTKLREHLGLLGALLGVRQVYADSKKKTGRETPKTRTTTKTQRKSKKNKRNSNEIHEDPLLFFW